MGAHRQAWAWQDEWHGLTMEAIREFERETQLLLQKKFGADDDDDDGDGIIYISISFVGFTIKCECLCVSAANPTVDLSTHKHSSQFQSIEKTEETPMFPKKLSEPPKLKEHPPSVDDSSDGEDDVEIAAISNVRKERSASGQLSQHSRFGSKHCLHSPAGSSQNFDLQVRFYLTTTTKRRVYTN